MADPFFFSACSRKRAKSEKKTKKPRTLTRPQSDIGFSRLPGSASSKRVGNHVHGFFELCQVTTRCFEAVVRIRIS
jgi:hypothetical protein